MEKSEEYVLVEAIGVAKRNGKLSAELEEGILSKIKTAELENSDYDFLSVVIKAALMDCYTAMSSKDEDAKELSKQERYLLTAKKLETEVLNRALDIVMSRIRRKSAKRNTLYSLFVPLLMFMPAQAEQVDITEWLPIVLAFVSIFMLIYAVLVVRKAKRHIPPSE
jgi:hypothetical protein